MFRLLPCGTALREPGLAETKVRAGPLDDSGRPRGPLCCPQLPNPNLVQLLAPVSPEWKAEGARCLGSDQESGGGGSLGERHRAALLPFREAGAPGPGSRPSAEPGLPRGAGRGGAGAGGRRAKGGASSGGMS